MMSKRGGRHTKRTLLRMGAEWDTEVVDDITTLHS